MTYNYMTSKKTKQFLSDDKMRQLYCELSDDDKSELYISVIDNYKNEHKCNILLTLLKKNVRNKFTETDKLLLYYLNKEYKFNGKLFRRIINVLNNKKKFKSNHRYESIFKKHILHLFIEFKKHDNDDYTKGTFIYKYYDGNCIYKDTMTLYEEFIIKNDDTMIYQFLYKLYRVMNDIFIKKKKEFDILVKDATNLYRIEEERRAELSYQIKLSYRYPRVCLDKNNEAVAYIRNGIITYLKNESDLK